MSSCFLSLFWKARNGLGYPFFRSCGACKATTYQQILSLTIAVNFLGLLGISESWPCPLNKPLVGNSSGLMLIQIVVKSFMIFSQMRCPHQTCCITLWPRLVHPSKTTKTDQKFDFKANTHSPCVIVEMIGCTLIVSAVLALSTVLMTVLFSPAGT